MELKIALAPVGCPGPGKMDMTIREYGQHGAVGKVEERAVGRFQRIEVCSGLDGRKVPRLDFGNDAAFGRGPRAVDQPSRKNQ